MAKYGGGIYASLAHTHPSLMVRLRSSGVNEERCEASDECHAEQLAPPNTQNLAQ